MKAFVCVLAILAAVACAKEVRAVADPGDRSWKECFEVGKFGTVCGIIYVEPANLTIGGRLTWDGHQIFDYHFSANQICANEDELLKLIELIPALAEFKPVIDKVIKVLGHLPAKVFSVCLGLHDITWKGNELSACADVDITLVCWMKKCAWKGKKELGCFTI